MGLEAGTLEARNLGGVSLYVGILEAGSLQRMATQTWIWIRIHLEWESRDWDSRGLESRG